MLYQQRRRNVHNCCGPCSMLLTSPLVTMDLVRLDDDRILPLAKGVFFDLRVELVAPAEGMAGMEEATSGALTSQVAGSCCQLPCLLQQPCLPAISLSLCSPQATALARPAFDACCNDGPVLRSVISNQAPQHLILLQ